MARLSCTSAPAAAIAVPEHDHPAVSFIAVAYGTGPIIVDSIASLVTAMSPAGLTYEYLVVDNLDPDTPGRTRRELALTTRGVRLIEPGTNLGFGGGCEFGALYARGPVLAFVNPDVEFLPGFAEPLVAALDEQGVSIAAPVMLDPDGSVQEAGQQLFADASTRPVVDAPAPGEVRTCTFSSAACWMMRRSEHERVGGFDPAFHPAYLEDVDLALRAASLGGRSVVVGSSRIVHHRGSSTRRFELPDLRPSQRRVLSRYPELTWRQPPSALRPAWHL